MAITLTTGTLDSNDNLDGWIITSRTATAEGAEDVPLRAGDRIDLHGNVHRHGEIVANIS